MKKRVWLSIVIMLVFALFALGSTSSDEPSVVDSTSTEVPTVSDDTSSDKTEQPTSEPATEIPEDKVFLVGEIVDLNNTHVQILSVTKSSGSTYDTPKDGHEYIIVDVAIKNSSNDSVSYNSYDFSMQNSLGQVTDSAFSIVDTDTALSSGELLPGGLVSGTITFEQPIDDAGLILIYEPSIFSDSAIRFDVLQSLETFEPLQGEVIKSSEEEFSINETVEINGKQLSVDNVEYSNGSDFDKPQEGKEYVIITLTIKNASSENISYNPFDFEMSNSQGQVVNQAFTIIDTDTALQSGELVSGGSVSGTIVFEQPIGDTDLKLIYTDNIFSDASNVTIKISQ